MAIEKERKFLVKDSSFKNQASNKFHIVQGYLSSNPDCTIRLRLRNEKAFLTIKGASTSNGLERYEWEKEIPFEEAKELLLLCEPGLIDKHRYIVPFQGHIWEVDEFHNENEGLILAEIELSRTEFDIPMPDFILKEVTGDDRYYNSSLKNYPYSSWEKK